jgi:pyrroloquinoline-quinone synthase
MHEGKLTRGQLQAWVLNRYYYQSRIPIKDAIILSRSDDPGFRRAWRKRVLDHDGDNNPEGGIERWIGALSVAKKYSPGFASRSMPMSIW